MYVRRNADELVTHQGLSESTSKSVALALTLMLVVIWLLTHRYQGISQDARIYAVQALARIDPTLGADLYLQNTSQDRYTLFSPFYALVISLIGLPSAARALTVVFAAAFLGSSWKLARCLVGKDEAWLSVGALILIVGAYGSHSVFHFSEDYLSARSAAEAAVATALAAYFGGHRRGAYLLAASALLIHPLMALPGVLLLIFLSVPLSLARPLAIAGIALTSCLAMAASTLPAVRTMVPIMDSTWLDIVMERAEYLFLQLWSLRDWEVNLRPFASLGLSALVLTTPRIRSLCVAAALVGAAGLVVALVAGTVGPVPLLVQGQAWRWVWVSVFIGTILVPSTAICLWQEQRIGPMCAVFLVASWTLPASATPSLAFLALALFSVRRYLPNVRSGTIQFTALVTALALLGWEAAGVFTPVAGMTGAAMSIDDTKPFLQRTATIALGRYPMTVVLLATWQLLRSASHRVSIGLSIALGCAGAFLVPVSFAKSDTAGTPSEIAEFADWRGAIPTSDNVYVADGRDAAPFAWFTLKRPNYLSLDQSAGVVFSRATALEIRRRSEILKPLMDEDWKLLSRNRAVLSAGFTPPRRTPLTAESLVLLCSDPQLGFLISRENVGFDPIRHEHPGIWMHWNLYDCRHVRTSGRAT